MPDGRVLEWRFGPLESPVKPETLQERRQTEPTSNPSHIKCHIEVDALVTTSSLENLFTTLRDDIVSLKQELAADVKDIRRNMGELEHSIDSLEGVRDEELEKHRHESLSLRDRPQLTLEDLENRSRRCNIHIKGIPLQAGVGRLKDYILRLSHLVAIDMEGQDTILDRTHRVGRQARSPEQPQDILTCLHYYWQKEAIMAE
ncbi:hypothetical protein NDU88_009683 [Pleurodeles waltl]|uniref:Uncharacterized protein n=1 Tax=Pleurodeles waltl TaxID=8319 RepID=A0AAV7QWG4_PLEWA|nr:hypothetical protein NDU88_009683 [Pleurodeles waltl]